MTPSLHQCPRRILSWTFIAACALLCLVMAWQGAAAKQAESSQTNATAEEMPDWIKPPEFAYTSRGKPDPFKPFIQQNEPQQSAQSEEESEPQRPLTPLEKVQPSQLSLEGILWKGQDAGDSLALVQLPDGKGFVLKPGTKIGRRQGEVVRIEPDRVVIREVTESIFGEKEQQEVVLKLHTSGEEND